jgi:hypothetical protein
MGISKFLFKPVLRNDLARVLREALDDTRGRQRPEAIQ